MESRNASAIHITGLSKLDYHELQHEFKGADIEFKDEAMPGGKHGELVTTAVIIISIAAVKLLGAWLLKNRDRNRIRRTIEIVDKDGVKRTETLDMDLSSSKAPEADVLSGLAKLLDIDPASLLNK